MKLNDIICDPFSDPMQSMDGRLVYLKSSDLVEELVLKYSEFDMSYDLTIFTSKVNNATLSYYGERELSDEELLLFEYMLFQPKVIEDFKVYIAKRELEFNEQNFIMFFKLFARNYRIKIEPADFLGVI